MRPRGRGGGDRSEIQGLRSINVPSQAHVRGAGPAQDQTGTGTSIQAFLGGEDIVL